MKNKPSILFRLKSILWLRTRGGSFLSPRNATIFCSCILLTSMIYHLNGKSSYVSNFGTLSNYKAKTAHLVRNVSLNEEKETTNIHIWQRNSQRIEMLNRGCNELNVSRSAIGGQLYKHLHIDKKHKFVYCYVPKVACTSWKRVLIKIKDAVKTNRSMDSISRLEAHTKLPTLQGESKSERENILSTYKKFMFVRHPFLRILSAYKDKLLHTDTESLYNFHEKIGKQIESKLGLDSLGGHNISFTNFVEWLIMADGRETVEQQNEHWVTVHDLCSPCVIKYDFIGHYETLHEDASAVLDWLQVKDVVPKFPSADRPTNSSFRSSKYYKEIGDVVMSLLQQQYLADTLPFGYEWKNF